MKRGRKATPKPAYDFFVFEKARTLDKECVRRYKNAVARGARKTIPSPLETSDITVEILYSTRSNVPKADIDDVIRPTLEGLEGIAYREAGQVRSVTATFFDRGQNLTLSKKGGYMGPFLFSSNQHVFLIRIFSEAALRSSDAPRPSVSPVPAGWLSRGRPEVKIRGNATSKSLRKE